MQNVGPSHTCSYGVCLCHRCPLSTLLPQPMLLAELPDFSCWQLEAHRHDLVHGLTDNRMKRLTRGWKKSKRTWPVSWLKAWLRSCCMPAFGLPLQVNAFRYMSSTQARLLAKHALHHACRVACTLKVISVAKLCMCMLHAC